MSTPVPTTKICTKCKQEKPIEGWLKGGKHDVDGLHSWCKDCYREYDRKRGAKRRLSKEYREKQRKDGINQWKRHPERMKARHMAMSRRAKLIKDACETCGGIDNLQLHHPDYSKPLYVLTLCREHHEEVHHGPATKPQEDK